MIFLVFAVLFMVAAAAGIGFTQARKPPKPREPLTDMSPAAASLLSGYSRPAYWAPVRAVTPGGITVRQARCCQRGHQSPKQAVTHAASIKQRIETTGR